MSDSKTPDVERETAIASEVQRIKREYPYKGDYREQLSALLSFMFLKFGERVGANRLAAMLAENGKSPSTSTAQDEINKFWERIRANAAVKIVRPDVPQALLDLFGELAAQAWQSGLTEANITFEAHRQELLEQVRAAEGTVRQAHEQLAGARAGAESALREVALANERREALGNRLAAESANLKAAQAKVTELTERLSREQQLRAEESARTQAILQDLRESLDQAMTEQRRLLAIGDDYKQQAARDRTLRLKAEEAQERSTRELERLQQRVEHLSGEKGVLEGRLASQDQQIARLERDSDKSNKMGQVTERNKARRPGLRIRGAR